MAGRIQRIRRFRGRGFQRGQRPIWHTTFRGKSSVLYLYPKTDSKAAACVPLKHRLLLLRCGVIRSLPQRKQTFERRNRNGDVLSVMAPFRVGRRIEVYRNHTMELLLFPMELLAETVQSGSFDAFRTALA